MVNLTTVKATTACSYWSVHAAKSLSTGRPVCAIFSRSYPEPHAAVICHRYSPVVPCFDSSKNRERPGPLISFEQANSRNCTNFNETRNPLCLGRHSNNASYRQEGTISTVFRLVFFSRAFLAVAQCASSSFSLSYEEKERQSTLAWPNKDERWPAVEARVYYSVAGYPATFVIR